MPDFWNGKKVLVTGGHGFLGSHLVGKLQTLNAEVIAPTHKDYDLVDGDQVRKMYQDHPDAELVIHLAATVGGIGANREHPGKFFYENLMMGVQLLHEAYVNKIPKFVALGTVF
jgi:GDP-L-fucose synthase